MKYFKNFKESSKRDKTIYITNLIIRVFCISFVVYAIIMIALGHNEKSGRVANVNVTGIFQASSLFICTFIPNLIEKIWKIKLPFYIVFLFLAFIIACLWLGELLDFYIHFSWWDDVLHTFSGVYIAAIGFFVVSIVNARRDEKARLSPGFVAVYAFVLALASECVWEIFEFLSDTFFGSNMQRAYESTSFKDNGAVDSVTDPNFNALVGRDALIDTMGDMIEVLVGALILCILGYILLKNEERIRTHLMERKNRKANLNQKQNNETEQLESNSDDLNEDTKKDEVIENVSDENGE